MPEAPKLCNPTPFAVELPFDRGTRIVVPADSSINLSAAQYESFRSGQAGSEGIRQVLEMAGVFLLDMDLSYDFQALKSIESTIRMRRERVNGFVSRLEVLSTSQGSDVDVRKIENAKKMAGISRMENEIQTLESRRAAFRENLGETSAQKQRAQLDPKRTCFVSNPPKEFPSVLALQIYLKENPDIAAKHEETMARLFPEGV